MKNTSHIKQGKTGKCLKKLVTIEQSHLIEFVFKAYFEIASGMENGNGID